MHFISKSDLLFFNGSFTKFRGDHKLRRTLRSVGARDVYLHGDGQVSSDESSYEHMNDLSLGSGLTVATFHAGTRTGRRWLGASTPGSGWPACRALSASKSPG